MELCNKMAKSNVTPTAATTTTVVTPPNTLNVAYPALGPTTLARELKWINIVTKPPVETPTVYVPASGRSGSRVVVNNHFHMGMVKALVRNSSATIKLLHNGNPRQPGTDTFYNWKFYETETTFGAYVKHPDYIGGERKALDTLLWDLRRGFITVTNVPDNVLDVIMSMPKQERGFGRY